MDSTGGENWRYVGLIVGAAVVTRLLSTIYYIEDPDSLRFALSVYDEFAVAERQPHFPGYPVFWVAARVFYLLTNSLAVTFSVIGGLATGVIVWVTVRMANRSWTTPAAWIFGVLVLFNPLIWLMGTRYMPDLLGVAGVLTTFYLLVHEDGGYRERLAGMMLAGLMTGLRLSYMPFLMLPVALHLFEERRRLPSIAAGAVGVVLWLIPLIVDTGWTPLWKAAAAQATGHFTEFGGTVATDPQLGRRLVHLIESLWADGLGGFWPGRHPVTVVVGLGLAGFGVGGIGRLREMVSDRMLSLLTGSAAIYVLWIFFYQNIIHKPRHVLLLIPLLVLPIGCGMARGWQTKFPALRVVPLLWFLAYSGVTGVLVWQHRQPTAIAQVKEHLARIDDDSLQVGSIPLVNYYMAGQGIDARYFSMEDSADWARLRRAASHRLTVVISENRPFTQPRPTRVDSFYHNPYVNRMWPQVQVYTYEP